MMNLEVRPDSSRARRADAELREGIQYTLSHPPVRMLVVIVGMISLFGVSVGTLIPAWAVKILHGNATTNGLLQSARGVGPSAAPCSSLRWEEASGEDPS